MNKNEYNSVGGVAQFDTEGFRDHEKDVFDTYFKNGRILDLGCGTGRTSILLHERGLDVEAIDYAENMIARAKEKYPHISFRVMDAMKLEYPDASFDHVLFSFNGIDYLYPEHNRLKALSEIHRVLKSGGIFAFSSHNALLPTNISRLKALLKSALRGRIYPYRYDFQEFGPLLTYFVTPRKQRTQLEKAGFEFLEVHDENDRHPLYVARKK